MTHVIHYVRMENSSAFEIVTTHDGSPTLVVKESMHRMEGAFEESLFVYGRAINMVFEKSWAPNFLSLGLGLGYNELLIVAMAIKRGVTQVYIESFEQDDNLINEFVGWVFNQKSQSPLSQVYDQMIVFFESHFGVKSHELKSYLRRLYNVGQWKVQGPLLNSKQIQFKHSALFWDAYSKKTDPHLWEEKFLNDIISEASLNPCVFASYSANGVLKRTLKALGFVTSETGALGRKRESTLAVRSYSPTN